MSARWWWVLGAFCLLAVAYGVTVGVLAANQEEMIFPGAYLPPPKTPGPGRPGVQQIWITSDDGQRVEAWYQPGRGRSADSPGPAYIYFHGNGDTVDTAWWIADHTVPRGMSTLVVEYHGYGRCGGTPGQDAIIVDSIRFYDWLAARPEVDAKRIVLHGTSLGGAVAIAVADQRPAAAIVLECTFTSISDLAHRYFIPASLLRHPFHSDRIIGRLDVPIAIFHGRHDGTIPFSHGQKLYKLAKNARFTPLDCGHGDFHNDYRNVAAFLEEVGVVGATKGGIEGMRD